MKHPFLNFLSSALIPELSSDISTGSSCNIHLILITVAAVRTLPHKLAVIVNDLDFSVITANLTVVALCVKLCIHNVIVNELDNL